MSNNKPIFSQNLRKRINELMKYCFELTTSRAYTTDLYLYTDTVSNPHIEKSSYRYVRKLYEYEDIRTLEFLYIFSNSILEKCHYKLENYNDNDGEYFDFLFTKRPNVNHSEEREILQILWSDEILRHKRYTINSWEIFISKNSLRHIIELIHLGAL